MRKSKELSPEDQKLLEDFRRKFAQGMKERPLMSDEEFMAETGASDEQYAMGVVLPGVGETKG